MSGFARLGFGQGLIGDECSFRGVWGGESFEWGLVADLDVPLDGLRRDSSSDSPQLVFCFMLVLPLCKLSSELLWFH
jgi:hypothetical protein